MLLFSDPQVWLSFLALAVLEIVLGIDNVIFLSMLVERLPERQRGSARILGLSFAMLTRIALLFSITWLATLRTPLFSLLGTELSAHEMILFAGGLFLVVKSSRDIRGMLAEKVRTVEAGLMNSFWLIIAQIGILDIVFSLDSVFTAIGLARHIEVMVAAIVLSVLVMMVVASAVGAFINRFPTLKVLALAFLVLVGAGLMAEAMDLDVPKAYLYFALAFAAAVEWINLRLRPRGKP
jgi:predicted tellurium resistance membrane protein TerC